MASEKAIAEMFVIFKQMWPNRETTKHTANIYYLTLHDVDDEELMKAVRDCVEECKFFPVPAEIRKYIKTDGIPTAEAALSMALVANNINELPEVVKTTLKNIGGLSALQERDFNFMRRHFLDAYSEISQAFHRKERRKRYKALLPEWEKTIKLLEAPK